MIKHFNNTLFIGKQFISLPSCPSTNDLALEMSAKKLLHDGAVIHAVEQTKGRGQRGNSWLSAAGKNLTCSFYLLPKFLKPSQQFELNRIVSLALIDTLNEFIVSNELKIKWPNDIYLGDKKIAGILIENVINHNAIYQSVIGVGINVNQRDHLLHTATSMIENGLKEIQILHVLEVLGGKIEKYLFQVKTHGCSSLYQAYIKNLYLLKEKRVFEDEKGRFLGEIDHVTTEGFLIIKDEEGLSRNYQFKEVKFLLDV